MSERPAPPRLPGENITAALLLITALAAGLRFLGLGSQSFWVDELITLWQATAPGHGALEQFLDDVHNPLPTLLARAMAGASESEAWLRLPSALLGSLSPLLLFAVVRPLAGARAGLLAALLLAVNPMHVDHSQELRGYAWMVFFGLAAITRAQAATREAPSAIRWVGVAVLGTLCALGNLQGLFWMGGLALGLLVAGRLDRRQLPWAIGAFALVLALTAPWWSLSLGIHEAGRLVPGEATGEPLRGEATFSPWALPWAGFALAFGPQLGPPSAELHRLAQEGRLGLPTGYWPVAAVAALLVLVLASAGLAALRRRSLGPLAWALVPVVVAVLLALRNVKPFNPRYVLAALPTLLLVVGAGLHRTRRGPALALLLLWLGLSGVGLYRHHFDARWRHEDLRGAAELLEDRGGEGDAIVAPSVHTVVGHYYDGAAPVHDLPGRELADPAEVRAALDRIAPDRRYLWYVRSRPWFDDPHGWIVAALEGRYRRMARHELEGVEVYLYDRERPPARPD